jgi:hypothetical protein
VRRLVAELFAEHLDGEPLLRADPLGLVDEAHAAFADHAKQPIVADVDAGEIVAARLEVLREVHGVAKAVGSRDIGRIRRVAGLRRRRRDDAEKRLAGHRRGPRPDVARRRPLSRWDTEHRLVAWTVLIPRHLVIVSSRPHVEAERRKRGFRAG